MKPQTKKRKKAPSKHKPTISLCMITRNEDGVLSRCLDSLGGSYDELIIVDNGSKDKTKEIAMQYTDHVYDFFDCNEPPTADGVIMDFSLLRNKSFDMASKDWIMFVDADDILEEGGAGKIRALIEEVHENKAIKGINMPYIYSHEAAGSGMMPNFKYYRLRLIRRGAGRWQGRVHEYVPLPDKSTLNSEDIVFHHFRDEGKGTQNTKRNLRILQRVVDEASPAEKPRYLFYLGKEYTYNSMWHEAIDIFLKYLDVASWIPEKHRAMYELGHCFYVLRDFEKAKKYSFMAIELDEDYCDPYITLGRMAYDLKEWMRCIKWMSCVPKLGTPEVHFFDFIPHRTYVPYDHMCIAYWELGMYEESLSCAEKCLEYRPGDPRYKSNYERIKQHIDSLTKN